MSMGTILLVVIVGVVIYLISIYNNLVSLRAGINSAWSDIDVQLKRRYDLIPALVESVKGYKEYESETLQDIIKLRQQEFDVDSLEEKAKISNALSKALSHLFALAEAYPDLKANTNFLNLQNELSHIEDAIQNARRYYNAIVRDYNAKIESFPDMLIAQRFEFTPREYFELQESEKQSVQDMPDIKF